MAWRVIYILSAHKNGICVYFEKFEFIAPFSLFSYFNAFACNTILFCPLYMPDYFLCIFSIFSLGFLHIACLFQSLFCIMYIVAFNQLALFISFSDCILRKCNVLPGEIALKNNHYYYCYEMSK